MGRPSKPAFVIGDNVEHWVVVGHTRVARIGGDTREAYVCECKCGTRQVIEKSRLKTNAPKQCRSCASKEVRVRLGSWGQTQLPEYHVWASMKARCSVPALSSYKNYGARGIMVCKNWQNFNAFYKDMGPRPSAQHSIERLDNEKGYFPGNCIWAEADKQQSNRRNNCRYTARGETKTVAAWAKQLGVASSVIQSRIFKHGWSIEKACTTPAYEPRRITVGGVTRNIFEWAKVLNTSRSTIFLRLGRGWTEEAAVTTPVRAKRRT